MQDEIAKQAFSQYLCRFELAMLSPSEGDPARAAILADDFLEFGSSGRVYDKAAILELLRQRGPIDFSIENFRATLLAPGVALATYEFVVKPAGGGEDRNAGGSGGTAPRRSLRSSIFVVRDGVWLMRFHQGTLVPGGE